MKKIVRLKESDIENLVKKIIKEDKTSINEVSVDKIVSKIKSRGGKVESTDEEKLMTYVKNKIKKGKEYEIRKWEIAFSPYSYANYINSKRISTAPIKNSPNKILI